MKMPDIEKIVEKINSIGKIIAFIGIVLSLFVKLNRMFGFIDLDKLKIRKSKDEPSAKEEK